MLKIGDKIFFEKYGDVYQATVTEVQNIDGVTLYACTDNIWSIVDESEVLDDIDKRVRKILAQTKDKMISLSEVRSWLKSYARSYYESDEWSEFKDEDMIADLCYDMLYGNN